MLRCLYEFKSLELCLRNNCAVFAMILERLVYSKNLDFCVCVRVIYYNILKMCVSLCVVRAEFLV